MQRLEFSLHFKKNEKKCYSKNNLLRLICLNLVFSSSLQRNMTHDYSHTICILVQADNHVPIQFDTHDAVTVYIGNVASLAPASDIPTTKPRLASTSK
jgi:hypothetical protein